MGHSYGHGNGRSVPKWAWIGLIVVARDFDIQYRQKRKRRCGLKALSIWSKWVGRDPAP